MKQPVNNFTAHTCNSHEVIKISLNCTKLYCVYIYTYIHTVMNTIILQIVAIYNIQLHVSALYVGHHQVVKRY